MIGRIALTRTGERVVIIDEGHTDSEKIYHTADEREFLARYLEVTDEIVETKPRKQAVEPVEPEPDDSILDTNEDAETLELQLSASNL